MVLGPRSPEGPGVRGHHLIDRCLVQLDPSVGEPLDRGGIPAEIEQGRQRPHAEPDVQRQRPRVGGSEGEPIARLG